MSEAWLRGPVNGVPDVLQPAAHSLIDAVEDMEAAVAGVQAAELWLRPGGVASIGFHLRHVPGSIDRLLTYARGEALTSAQLEAARNEGDPPEPPVGPGALMEGLRASRDRALDTYRATDVRTLADPRFVGRRRLPSTVYGLLFHAAEHARRHAGQVVATAGFLGGLRRGGHPVGTTGTGPEVAERVRSACLEAVTTAYEEAGIRGLCAEGRWEAAVGALKSLDWLTHTEPQGGTP